MADEKKEKELLAAPQEFVQVFKKGSEFTEELLKENERLRYRIAELESQKHAPKGKDDGLVKELIEKCGRLEGEREELARRFKEVEAENRDFAARYVEIEAENNNLLNIYVASYQLHSTLNFDEVLQIITEIILNFIGAEVFAIALLQEQKQELVPMVVEGIDPDLFKSISLKEGLVADVLKRGEPYFTHDILQANDAGDPAACIPLRIKDRSIGVILIYKFLMQKTELGRVDQELFSLLVGHAATAIFSARLYSDSQRKLNTIQGLIDLVTS